MRVLLAYLALGAVGTIITGAQAQAVCLSQLPDKEEVVSLAEEALSNGTYNVTYSLQYLFTSLVFNCSGAITGWTTVALGGTGGARPEISVWRQSTSNPTEYTKQSGVLMDGCVTQEISPSIHVHQTSATALIEFEVGDVLGILYRRDNVFHFAPLLVEEANSSQTGYDRERGGGSDSFDIDGASPTNLLPLVSLDICLRGPSGGDGTYPHCSDVILPSESCPKEPSTTSTSTTPTASSSPPLSTELLLVIVFASVIVLVGVVVVVVVTVLCCICARRKDKMDISPQSPANDIPMNGLHPSIDGDTPHTYETPLGEPGPSVVLSSASNSNHVTSSTRRPNRACSYEEPLVCLSQQESISGSQLFFPGNDSHPGLVYMWPTSRAAHGDQHMYDYLRSPASNLPPLPTPPIPSRHTSPQFLSPTSAPTTPRFQLTAPPSSIATTAYYHTLERPFGPPSFSPTQLRHAQSPRSVHSSAENSPLANRHFVDLSNNSAEQKPHIEAYASLNPSPPGPASPTLHLIAGADTSLNLESGVYVPTQHQRNQLLDEPIFDDSVYSTLRKAPNSPGAHNWSFFEESEHYWKPASDSASLYHQLFSKKYREINYKQVQITEHLGSGEFGTVCKGFWHTSKGSVEVAVKMVNRQATEQDKVRFLQEAAIMGQFRHPNIVRLYGVVTVHEPVMIVLELMKKGDLKNYVKSLRPVPGELVSPQLQHRLLQFCHDVALGMEYLARKEFVHRDLAARNILLTEDCTCKIADFGMSRDLDDGEYYISHGGKIPFKWTAPEALHYRKYSTASDMWSYGILLWEVWSLGHTPYRDCHTPDETMVRVDSTSRMPPPPGCPRVIYQLMMECWSPKPSGRPTFTHVVQTLSQPPSLLLHWAEEDRQSHPQASCLGALMEAGKDLFPDLQMMHSKPST